MDGVAVGVATADEFVVACADRLANSHEYNEKEEDALDIRNEFDTGIALTRHNVNDRVSIMSLCSLQIAMMVVLDR